LVRPAGRFRGLRAVGPLFWTDLYRCRSTRAIEAQSFYNSNDAAGVPDLRLFVALPLPAEIRSALLRWTKSCGAQPGLRWTPEDQLHITLHFLGEVAEANLDAVLNAIAAIAAPAFPIALHRVEVLGRAGVLVARATPSPPFVGLAQAVRSRLGIFSEILETGRAFHPHVTLARARHGGAVPKPRALPPLPELKFTAACFRLVRSELRSEGAIHTAIREWKLERAGAPL
jgi:2'-5' RNA ligase